MFEYWKDIAYLIGIVVAFFTGNRTKKIDDLVKYQEMYEKFYEQYQKQYGEVLSMVDSLKKNVQKLEDANILLINENHEWEKKFSSLKTLYDNLKVEFENYKNTHE